MHTSHSNKRTILITMGDPSGIGPEVTIKALASRDIRRLANFFVIGDGFVMAKLAKRLGLKLDVPLLDLRNVPKGSFSYGRTHPFFGRASIEYIDAALKLLKEGTADALVTGPINKRSIEKSGLKDFKGHTEYLAENTARRDVAMMFVGKNLKVTLVTRHIPLRSVSASLSVSSIYKMIMLTHKYMKEYFALRRPRIGVAGLNPHAGESGLFGDDETHFIIPAIRKASRNVKGIVGPLPPDVIFYEAFHKRLDAVVAMYHDQALAPFKMLYFKDGVNLTIGLPFVRTSPDHGTAFDIAGRFIADPSSMKEAIKLACRLTADKPIKK